MYTVDFEDVFATVSFLMEKNRDCVFWTTYQERRCRLFVQGGRGAVASSCCPRVRSGVTFQMLLKVYIYKIVLKLKIMKFPLEMAYV